MRAELAQWTGKYPEVVQWLGSVTPGTAEGYARAMELFMEWITGQPGFEGYDPITLLDYQDKASGREKVKLVNYLNEWSRENTQRFRPETVRRYHNSIRAYFSYNGVTLSRRDFSFPDTFKEQAPQLLKRENIVSLLAASKLRDRAIFTIAFQGGMGYNEFNQFNRSWKAVAPQINNDFVKVSLRGRKTAKGRTEGFYSILMGDGLALLREYLKVRGEPKPGEPIFMRIHAGREDDDGEPDLAPRTYRKNFETLCRRIGLISTKGEGRGSKYEYTAHQLRDAFRTEWQRSGADTAAAEFVMGHIKRVDPNKYLDYMRIPEHVVKEYRKALPRLNVITNPDPDSVPLSKVEALERELETTRRAEAIKTQSLDAKIDSLAAQVEMLLNGEDDADTQMKRILLKTIEEMTPEERKAYLKRLKESDNA